MQAINNDEVYAPSPFPSWREFLIVDNWPEFNERGVYYQFQQAFTIS